MTTRTMTTSVTFSRPFAISGVDGLCPAGSYRVETDEELIDSMSSVAWRRVATAIHVHANGATMVLAISPAELEMLLQQDAPETAKREPANGTNAL
jgi:hypothetical protein